MVLHKKEIKGSYYDMAAPCKCNVELIQSNMLNFAKIPTEFSNLTVNSFNTDLYSISNTALAIKAKIIVGEYIKDFDDMQKKGKGIFLHSKTRGSGKTRLAVSCGNALIKVHKQRTRFITTLELLNQIKATYNDESKITEQKIIADFCEIPILILDDIGIENVTPWVAEIFFKIIDTRMTYRKVTIITSNLSIEQLKHDERIKSRLNRMCIVVQMPEEDIRRQLSKAENDEIIAKLLGGE